MNKTQTRKMLFLISGAVLLFLMLGVIAFMTATPPTSPNQPIFTLKQVIGGPDGSSLSWSFSKGQEWREATYCPFCTKQGISFDFSNMLFKYANCTSVEFFNDSHCFPKQNILEVGNVRPLGGCFNPPNGNYTIYGYLNRTSPSAKNTTPSGVESCYAIPADPSKSEVLLLINNTEDGDPCAQGALRGYQAGKILAKYNITINVTTLLCNVNVNGTGGIYN